ncbi:MAG: TolC family protein [Armatimonadota bacterium]
MKLIFRIFALFVLTAIAGSVSAENPTASPSSPIDIDQALEIAFKNNPDLRIATDSVNKAKGVVEEAGARFNPSFSAQIVQLQQGPAVSLPANPLTGNQPITIMPASQTTAKLQFALPLDVFGRLRYGSDIAKDQFSINYLSLLRSSQQLIAQVKRNYYEQLRAGGQKDTAQAAVDVAAVRLKNTQARFEAGTVPKFDLTTAQVDLANLNQNLLAAESRVNIARANLNRVLGLDADAPTEVVKSPVKVDIDTVDVAEASKIAIEKRPEVKMQQTAIALNKTNIALQRTAAKPNLGLSGSYDYVSAQGFSTSNVSWNALANLNIPIWDGGVTKAKVDQAFADMYSAEDTLAQTELGITQEVATTISVLEEAAKRTRTTAESVALAEEALRLANVRYEAGIAVLVEVTNAESQLTQARFNEVNALYDYAIALADLQRATSSQPEIEKLRLVDYRPMLNLDAEKKSPEDRK